MRAPCGAAQLGAAGSFGPTCRAPRPTQVLVFLVPQTSDVPVLRANGRPSRKRKRKADEDEDEDEEKPPPGPVLEMLSLYAVKKVETWAHDMVKSEYTPPRKPKGKPAWAHNGKLALALCVASEDGAHRGYGGGGIGTAKDRQPGWKAFEPTGKPVTGFLYIIAGQLSEQGALSAGQLTWRPPAVPPRPACIVGQFIRGDLLELSAVIDLMSFEELCADCTERKLECDFPPCWPIAMDTTVRIGDRLVQVVDKGGGFCSLTDWSPEVRASLRACARLRLTGKSPRRADRAARPRSDGQDAAARAGASQRGAACAAGADARRNAARGRGAGAAGAVGGRGARQGGPGDRGPVGPLPGWRRSAARRTSARACAAAAAAAHPACACAVLGERGRHGAAGARQGGRDACCVAAVVRVRGARAAARRQKVTNSHVDTRTQPRHSPAAVAVAAVTLPESRCRTSMGRNPDA